MYIREVFNMSSTVAQNIAASALGICQELSAAQYGNQANWNNQNSTIWDGQINNADASETTQSEEVTQQEDAEPEKTKAELEASVKQLLTNTNINYDELSEDVQENLLKKYETITTYSKNNNINMSDTELTRRLTNYVKALNAHSVELQMSEVYTQSLEKDGGAEEAWENCTLKIEDEDIAAQKNKGATSDYIDSIVQRGEGYVDMYDSNGDGSVDFNEFKTFEEKDSGQTLADDEIEATKQYFNRLDKNNDGKLDSNEMATHLFATSRLFDGSSNTVEDITYKEWVGSQKLGKDADIDKNYKYASDEIYEYLTGQQ
jgi:hypothetical protein